MHRYLVGKMISKIGDEFLISASKEKIAEFRFYFILSNVFFYFVCVDKALNIFVEVWIWGLGSYGPFLS